MFRPVLPLCFLVLIPTWAGAQAIGTPEPRENPEQERDAGLCEVRPDDESCSLILACIGRGGRYFQGYAVGRGTGLLSGMTDDGATCQGTWTSRNRLGVGQADVSCDDGMSVTVFYTYQDEYTGTAVGRGVSNRGEPVKAWSGLNVLEYLSKETGKPRGTLLCGSHTVPIS